MATRLTRLRIEGFRCLDGLDLAFEPLTALIGANGAGKSSVLRALQFAFGQISLDDADCTDGDPERDVQVEVTLSGIPASWTEQLKPWLDGNGDLALVRHRVSSPDGRPQEHWSTQRAQAPGFGDVRAALDSGAPVAELRPLWSSAQEKTAGALPDWTSKAAAAQALTDFETANPVLVTERTEDRSVRFGPGGVDLSPIIELLVLPAMRDAADDAGESRGSTLSRLVDLTVRAGMGLDERLSQLTEKTAREYQAVLAEASGTRLEELSKNITNQLGSFAPGAQVTLAWEERAPVLAQPPVRARIIESGHEADIGRQGHGVQRAYVFSLLRALLEARRTEETSQPGLVLAIEEPEAYQHPLRARHVARVLENLAGDNAAATQVLYTTHSPYFVSVGNLSSVRTLRMRPVQATATDGAPAPAPDAAPSITAAGPEEQAEQAQRPTPARAQLIVSRTRATAPSPDDIADRLNTARAGTGRKWTRERVAAQLPGLLGVGLSEGLFADAVALCEGLEDLGILTGAAEAAGLDFAEAGVALIPVSGKDQLPLAMEVFRSAGVPTYVVFDTDDENEQGHRLKNAIITFLACGTRQERPGTSVGSTYASLAPTLRGVVDAEAGEQQVRDAFAAAANEMGLPEGTTKNGHLAHTAVRNLLSAGATTSTVTDIVHTVHTFGQRHVPR